MKTRTSTAAARGGKSRRSAPLHVELGCGKCVSTARMARENPNVNYLALDLSRDMLAVGRRGVTALYGGDPVENLKLGHPQPALYPADARARGRGGAALHQLLQPLGSAGGTSGAADAHVPSAASVRSSRPRRRFISKPTRTGCSAIRANTSRKRASTTSITWDLHASGFAPNYVTEHEARFAAQGIPIKFLIAKMRPISAGRERELRAAWLGDEETQAQVLHLDGEGGVIR